MTVSVPRLGKERVIHFLVDTGAAKTTLMPADARRLGVDFASDFANARSETASGIGGQMSLWLEPAQISLETADGLTDLIGLDIAVAELSESSMSPSRRYLAGTSSNTTASCATAGQPR